MRQTAGCLGVSSVIAACLLTSFCALWIPLGSLSDAGGPLFCSPPACSWITWGAGISAIILSVLGGLFGLWRNSIKGKSSEVEEALAKAFVLSRYIVGGIQGLLVPAIILLFLLGVTSLAGVLFVVFLVSLFGQLLILVGVFTVSPSGDEKEEVTGNIQISSMAQMQAVSHKQQFDGYQLIEEMEATLASLRKESPLLSKLPKGSWAANATLGHDTLHVEITKSDDLLIANDWHQLTDETYWLQFIVPKVARLLAKYQLGLPKGLIVKFKINSTTGPNVFFCSADELVNEADAISRPDGSGFGRMMALLDFE